MEDRRSHLSVRHFDILVVGAGMFGAGVAWAAARRGMSVAVVDQGDFGGATSSNHFRFIHGGIRYLQHLDLIRVRESSEEKSALIRLAPHLCHPMQILLPTYGHGRRGKLLLQAAMSTYDLLTLDRDRGIPDVARKTPLGRTVGKATVESLAPGIPREELTGAAVFHDGQMYNPARLVLAFLQSAVSHGAVAANYVRVDHLLRSGKRVIGCAVSDLRSGRSLEVKARMVINAAGPWAHRLLASQPDLTLRREPSFSRDLAFVVDKAVSDTHAIGCQAKSTDSDAVLDRGSRHLFLVPWHGKTLVGVWHGYTEMHPEKVVISRNELQGFLDEINGAYTGLDLTLDDIRMIYSGLILFGAKSEQGSAANHSFSKRALIHDHSKEGIHGIISVIGDRATVARRVAEKTVDMVANRIRTHTSARPATVPLRGGDIPDFEALVQEIRSKLPAASQHAARALAHNHGASYQDVFSCASLDDHLSTIGDSNVLAAEIIHAARSEMAFTLEDIVIRRTDLGSGGNPGDKAISVAADLAAHELGWTQQQRLSQIASLQELFQNLGPWVLVD